MSTPMPSAMAWSMRFMRSIKTAPKGLRISIFAMLKAGGSQHHKDLLAPFGLDAGDPKFWDKGLSMISAMIDELEAMEDGGS